MMTSQEILAIYEEMVVLTEQMVGAAAAAEWERLTQLEQRSALQVARLRAAEPAPLDGPNRDKKAAIIKQLLADDRKIRDLTTPWMTHLAALISSAGAERRLASAYGGA